MLSKEGKKLEEETRIKVEKKLKSKKKQTKDEDTDAEGEVKDPSKHLQNAKFKNASVRLDKAAPVPM